MCSGKGEEKKTTLRVLASNLAWQLKCSDLNPEHSLYLSRQTSTGASVGLKIFVDFTTNQLPFTHEEEGGEQVIGPACNIRMNVMVRIYFLPSIKLQLNTDYCY